ncbi:MAG TPA: ABC transporter permease subunit [Candidatus Limnocylindria bacterium]|nr:ABC transporter permease subunit [Candidatus Limnocylindria bacterium]
MTGIGPLLRKELLEQWRTRRLLVVAAVFIAFGIGSAFLARYTPELVEALAGDQFEIVVPPPTTRDAVDQFLKNLGQAGILTAILLAMGSVANEKERGTAALILSKPASRAAYLSAKLLAIGATLAVSLGLSSAAAYVYTSMLFEQPPFVGWIAMTGLLLLSLLVYAALTFLGSTLARSAVAAAGIGIGGMVVLAIVGALPNVGAYMPGGLATPAMGLALETDTGPVLGPFLVNLGLLLALAAASWWAFRGQEL